MEFVGPWTVHGCTIHGWLGQIVWLGKKEISENADAAIIRIQTGTISQHLYHVLPFCPFPINHQSCVCKFLVKIKTKTSIAIYP